jgi:ABC-2 type transport system ATP-binding protein
MIEFKNVYKKFNTNTYIEDACFIIRERSILGIVGETGIGKTEILRMICGFIKPDSGELIYDKYRLGEDYYKSISYLPEVDKININLTTYEYLEFFCNLYGISKIETENRINELLDFVELYDLKDRQVFSLTRFEEIKLSLARCLINTPKIILMDEPFSRLDMTSRSSLKNLIGDLNISGITFVIVSHLLSEVSDFCSDLVLFGGGRVAITGPTEYCLDLLNRNNPLRIEVLPKDVDITYKTLTNSIIVSRLVKDRNKFFVYFNEKDDKNVMQSRLLNMLMSQGIIPTLFAREANNNIDFKAIDNIAGGIIYEI